MSDQTKRKKKTKYIFLRFFVFLHKKVTLNSNNKTTYFFLLFAKKKKIETKCKQKPTKKKETRENYLSL